MQVPSMMPTPLPFLSSSSSSLFSPPRLHQSHRCVSTGREMGDDMERGVCYQAHLEENQYQCLTDIKAQLCTCIMFPSRSHLLSASAHGTLCLFQARDCRASGPRCHSGRVNSVAVHRRRVQCGQGQGVADMGFNAREGCAKLVDRQMGPVGGSGGLHDRCLRHRKLQFYRFFPPP
ncbi:hypothetical protein B0H12DRAFT_305281 [Mycena haematopus]|nr:hypothetical protein B0H12DRAFT_305281 [Mycena haematopus]